MSSDTGDTNAAMRKTPPAPFEKWLNVERRHDDLFVMRFGESHIGNPFIRALHGGAVGSLIEYSAERFAASARRGSATELISCNIEYLRVTRDSDLFARVSPVRFARRLAFVDVWCWQETEDLPVARGACILRLHGSPDR